MHRELAVADSPFCVRNVGWKSEDLVDGILLVEYNKGNRGISK